MKAYKDKIMLRVEYWGHSFNLTTGFVRKTGYNYDSSYSVIDIASELYGGNFNEVIDKIKRGFKSFNYPIPSDDEIAMQYIEAVANEMSPGRIKQVISKLEKIFYDEDKPKGSCKSIW